MAICSRVDRWTVLGGHSLTTHQLWNAAHRLEACLPIGGYGLQRDVLNPHAIAWSFSIVGLNHESGTGGAEPVAASS